MALTCSSALRAQPSEIDLQAAARAFQAGQEAQVAGDAERAARMFEVAHAIAPTPQALRSALRAHLAAEHSERAATLALEAQTLYPDDADCAALSEQVLARLEPGLGLLAVRCSEACFVVVDDQAASLRTSVTTGVYVEPGLHVVRASFGEHGSAVREVDVLAGERLEVLLDAPAQTPRPAQVATVPASPPSVVHAFAPADRVTSTSTSARKPLRPWTFWTAVAATTGAGVASLVSAVDATERERSYERDPTRSGYEVGVDAQRRTEILLGLTGALAVGTGVIAWLTDFDAHETPVPELALRRDGASLMWRRQFP